jgi:hypothetical protein
MKKIYQKDQCRSLWAFFEKIINWDVLNRNPDAVNIL